MVSRLLFVVIATVALVTACSSGQREVKPTTEGNPPKCVVVETYDTDWVGNRINNKFNTYCLADK